MKCPICNVELLMTDKHGIEIDYCPTCRGIWLDRGELEKLVERMSALERGYVVRTAEESRVREYSGHNGHEHREYDKHDRHYGKREGLFGKIFDF